MTTKNETPKPAAVETTTKATPVNDRQYKLVAEPSIAPRGKQRQIVLAALKSAAGKPMNVKQVAEYATKAGLTAVGGIEPSVRYHLHHLGLLKIAEVVNPTIVIEKPVAKAESKTA